MAPQLSPSQSSSDEKHGPYGSSCKKKIAALEAERATSQALSVSAPERCCSARESRSHRKAKLKDLAEDLLSLFSALEGDCEAVHQSRKLAKSLATTPQC